VFSCEVTFKSCADVTAAPYLLVKHSAQSTAYVLTSLHRSCQPDIPSFSFALVIPSHPHSHPAGSIDAWFCSLKDGAPKSTAAELDSRQIYYTPEQEE